MFRFFRWLLSAPLQLLEGFSDGLTRLTQRLFAGRGGKERDTGVRVERGLGRLQQQILRPIVGFIDYLDHFTRPRGRRREIDYSYDANLDTSVDKQVERSFRAAQRRDKVKRILPVRLLALVLRPLSLFLNFVRKLFQRYGWKLLAYSLPLVVAVAAISYGFYTVVQNTSQLAQRYEVELREAIRNNDFDTAALFEKKLEQLGVRSESGEVQAAITLAEAGQQEQAITKMEAIVQKAPGQYPVAHLWLAQQLIAGKHPEHPVSDSESPALGLALQHLGLIEEQIGDSPAFQFLKGLAYYNQNAFILAYESLQDSPSELLEAAGLKMLAGQQLTQQSELMNLEGRDLQITPEVDATMVLRHLREIDSGRASLDAETPDENLRNWEVIARRILQEDKEADRLVSDWFEENPESPVARRYREEMLEANFDQAFNRRSYVDAERELNAWMALVPDSNKAKQRFVDLQLVYLDQLSNREGLQDPKQRKSFITIIAAVTKYIPELPKTVKDEINRRISYVFARREQPGYAELYQDMFQSDEFPVVWLEDLTTRHLIMKEWDFADKSYARVVQREPELAIAWNNWAYLINEAYPDRRQEALDKINKALELEPGNIDFLDTRASIYMSLEQWQAAIDDYLLVLNSVADTKPVHARIAIAYRRAGNDRLANQHAQEAR